MKIMNETQLEILKKKHFKEGVCPLDEYSALLFLSALDNLCYLKEEHTRRLEELRKLVIDEDVPAIRKSDYRYEGVRLYKELPLIEKTLSIGEQFTSYKKNTYKEFMEAYCKVARELDY